MSRVLNVSFYRFTRLGDLERLRDRVKARALEVGLHGSILLSHEGVNGFLAGEEPVLRAYLAWLVSEIPGLAGIRPKESFSSDIPFTRMLVKIKKEIITMGRPEVMPSEKTGKNLPAAELKRWYDEGKDFVIVDTRNDYEISQGAFRNAVHYDIETFREFPEKLEREAAKLREKTVVMYCTGGIRCEKATALAMDLGIRDVFQLEGGILKYFEEVGDSHYDGECFVFDHRAAVDPRLEARPDRVLREKTADLGLTGDLAGFAGATVIFALEAKSLPFAKGSVAGGAIGSGVEPTTVSADASPTGRDEPILIHGARLVRGAPAILAYLDEAFSENRSLTPASEERRERMHRWMEFAAGDFARDARIWISDGAGLSTEESHALEVRLEKYFYKLKTPLQRNRRYLVVDELTQADLAVYAVAEKLRAADFPRDYPERFALVWEWMDEVEAAIEAGRNPKPKVLRRAGEAIWPN